MYNALKHHKKNDEIKTKSKFNATATEPHRNRTFCQFKKDQYCILYSAESSNSSPILFIEFQSRRIIACVRILSTSAYVEHIARGEIFETVDYLCNLFRSRWGTTRRWTLSEIQTVWHTECISANNLDKNKGFLQFKTKIKQQATISCKCHCLLNVRLF